MQPPAPRGSGPDPRPPALRPKRAPAPRAPAAAAPAAGFRGVRNLSPTGASGACQHSGTLPACASTPQQGVAREFRAALGRHGRCAASASDCRAFSTAGKHLLPQQASSAHAAHHVRVYLLPRLRLVLQEQGREAGPPQRLRVRRDFRIPHPRACVKPRLRFVGHKASGASADDRVARAECSAACDSAAVPAVTGWVLRSSCSLPLPLGRVAHWSSTRVLSLTRPTHPGVTAAPGQPLASRRPPTRCCEHGVRHTFNARQQS